MDYDLGRRRWKDKSQPGHISENGPRIPLEETSNWVSFYNVFVSGQFYVKLNHFLFLRVLTLVRAISKSIKIDEKEFNFYWDLDS